MRTFAGRLSAALMLAPGTPPPPARSVLLVLYPTSSACRVVTVHSVEELNEDVLAGQNPNQGPSDQGPLIITGPLAVLRYVPNENDGLVSHWEEMSTDHVARWWDVLALPAA